MKTSKSDILGTILFALLMHVACPARAAISFIEWPVASGGNGHFYGITESATNWQTAENLAVSLGGHLASITTEAEQLFIETNFLVGDLANRPVWIGLTDRETEGTFTWVTGEPLSFTKWKESEPNNFGAGENYTAINWERGRGGPLGTWNDCPDGGTPDFGAGTVGPYFALIECPSNSPAPLVLSIELSCVDLCWEAAATTSYQLEYRSSLTTNMWAPLGFPIEGTGSRTCIVDSVRGQPQRYYRIQVLP